MFKKYNLTYGVGAMKIGMQGEQITGGNVPSEEMHVGTHPNKAASAPGPNVTDIPAQQTEQQVEPATGPLDT
jgi:hypothetical protein